MAITVAETQESRRGEDNNQIDFIYRVKGTPDPSAAVAAVISLIGTSTSYVATDVTLYWDQNIKFSPVPATVDETNTKGSWECIASFVRPENVDPESIDPSGEYSFEVVGTTTKITQSLQTVDSIAASAVPDFKGAIGVDADGKVDGADILTPTSSFSITKDQSAGFVTQTWRAETLPAIVNKTNSTAFEGYGVGEVLLEGVSGSRLGRVGDWRLTYRFLVSKDATAITIGDIGTIDKAGWDYLWILYEDQEDATAKKVVKQPFAAYVERVYERADYAGLGL